MLNASIDAGQKGFLELGINEFVVKKVFCCSLRQDKMVNFSDTIGQSYHSKVGWIIGVTFFVY